MKVCIFQINSEVKFLDFTGQPAAHNTCRTFRILFFTLKAQHFQITLSFTVGVSPWCKKKKFKIFLRQFFKASLKIRTIQTHPSFIFPFFLLYATVFLIFLNLNFLYNSLMKQDKNKSFQSTCILFSSKKHQLNNESF